MFQRKQKKPPLTSPVEASEGKLGVARVEAWPYPKQNLPQDSWTMKVDMVVIQIYFPLGRRGALMCLEI
jgi:hypothetical protein